jgi:hypothetical protein
MLTLATLANAAATHRTQAGLTVLSAALVAAMACDPAAQARYEAIYGQSWSQSPVFASTGAAALPPSLFEDTTPHGHSAVEACTVAR